MSEFRVRPGVVLIELRGNYLLVATKEARKHCRHICRINSTGAFLWEMIKNGFSCEEIMAGFSDKYEIDDPFILEKDVQKCIELLEEKGYIF